MKKILCLSLLWFNVGSFAAAPPTAPKQKQKMLQPHIKFPFEKKDAIARFVKTINCPQYKQENKHIPPNISNIFRIMTYNVHFWMDPTGKKDHMNQIINVIKTINPDIVLLQEVTPESGHKGKHFQNSHAAKVLQSLGYTHFSACNTMPVPGTLWFGNVIASKIAISNIHRASFKNQERPGQEDRCFAYAEIQLPHSKEKIHLYNTHLEVGKIKAKDPDKLREQQITQIADYISKRLRDKNTLIAGDFNASRKGKAVNYLLSENFKDCFSHLGWNYPQFTTWAGNEIDFIFLSLAWKIPLAGCYVYYDAASDHLPVIMDIVDK